VSYTKRVKKNRSVHSSEFLLMEDCLLDFFELTMGQSSENLHLNIHRPTPVVAASAKWYYITMCWLQRFTSIIFPYKMSFRVNRATVGIWVHYTLLELVWWENSLQITYGIPLINNEFNTLMSKFLFVCFFLSWVLIKILKQWLQTPRKTL